MNFEHYSSMDQHMHNMEHRVPERLFEGMSAQRYELIEIDEIILNECVDWIVQLTIYDTIMFFQNQRVEKISSKPVTKWVTAQCKRPCVSLEKQFKKCFSSIIPMYLKGSKEQKMLINQDITKRVIFCLETINHHSPRTLVSNINKLIDDAISDMKKPTMSEPVTSSYTSPPSNQTTIDRFSPDSMQQQDIFETSVFSTRRISSDSTFEDNNNFFDNNNNNQKKKRNNEPMKEMDSIEISDDEDSIIDNPIQTHGSLAQQLPTSLNDEHISDTDTINPISIPTEEDKITAKSLSTILDKMVPGLVERYMQEFSKEK